MVSDIYTPIAQNVWQFVCDNNCQSRIISFDLETKIQSPDDFLTNETILAIGMARRISKDEIEKKIFVLEDETEGSQEKLLEQCAQYLNLVRPLILVGYNICGYDFPLMLLKLKWYEQIKKRKNPDQKAYLPKEYWALKDALTRSYILDIMHPLRFTVAQYDNTTPKYQKLEYIISHPMCQNLNLLNTKKLAHGSSTQNKGEKIYQLWQQKHPDLSNYLQGDVHDVLVLAEELFLKK